MKETRSFNAEIKKLLDLMIHSLYSQKEIFLRELISNASDAMDKLKFFSKTHENLVSADHQFEIRLIPNKENQTLKIQDGGIGMTLEEVESFIGTIARSGTKIPEVTGEDIKDRPDLIGQFGVGFYSSFMVADKVTLHTQKAGTSEGVLWESVGDGTYTISQVPRPEGTGTTISLHLKKFDEEENVQDFTDEWVLKSLVKKYSDFIAYPIKMKTQKPQKDDKETTEKTVEKTEDETLNSMKALWLRPPSEISATEHKEFYHHLSHDWNDPLKTIHFKAEGTMEFTALLYLPSKKPFNYYMKDYDFGLSLYVKRVFIMDDSKELLPPFLRFVSGLVDSSDLSLNVSREILQQDRQAHQIRKSLVNKLLSTFKEMIQKERGLYETFWTEFGSTIKEGVPQEMQHRERLQDVLLFKSTFTESDAGKAAETKWTSLDEYVTRMKPDQKAIYFLSGDNLEQLKKSPHLERVVDRGFEVLLLTDAVDEWVTQSLTTFKEKKLQSLAQGNLDLDTEEEKQTREKEVKEATERYKDLLESLKKALASNVKDVVISTRLKNSPACLVSDANDPSFQMEKILSRINSEMGSTASKRILEVNPDHPVIERMRLMPDSKQNKWAEILYSQALLNEGSPLPDPSGFTRDLSDLMLEASSGPS